MRELITAELALVAGHGAGDQIVARGENIQVMGGAINANAAVVASRIGNNQIGWGVLAGGAVIGSLVFAYGVYVEDTGHGLNARTQPGTGGAGANDPQPGAPAPGSGGQTPGGTSFCQNPNPCDGDSRIKSPKVGN